MDYITLGWDDSAVLYTTPCINTRPVQPKASSSLYLPEWSDNTRSATIQSVMWCRFFRLQLTKVLPSSWRSVYWEGLQERGCKRLCSHSFFSVVSTILATIIVTKPLSQAGFDHSPHRTIPSVHYSIAFTSPINAVICHAIVTPLSYSFPSVFHSIPHPRSWCHCIFVFTFLRSCALRGI